MSDKEEYSYIESVLTSPEVYMYNIDSALFTKVNVVTGDFEKTGAELVKYSERKRVKSSDYDILVFGSSIIASRISGVEWFDKEKNEFKHSFLFVTGANPKEDNPELEKYIEAEKIKGHDIFYMPGGLNYERMSAPMRFVMKKMFLPMVKKEQGEDSIMYKMVSSSYSLYHEKYVQPLLDEIRRVFA